jgi:hypothetical protein
VSDDLIESRRGVRAGGQGGRGKLSCWLRLAGSTSNTGRAGGQHDGGRKQPSRTQQDANTAAQTASHQNALFVQQKHHHHRHPTANKGNQQVFPKHSPPFLFRNILLDASQPFPVICATPRPSFRAANNPTGLLT